MNRSVLVVDDDADQLALRVSILKESGLNVVAASSHQAAITATKSFAPCCAVVDLYMPTRDAGIRLLTALKHVAPSMRMLLLTGGKPGEAERALVDEVVIKGGGTAAIVEKVARLVRLA